MYLHNGDHAQFELDNQWIKPEERVDWPLPSFDAQDWAKCFMEKIIGKSVAIDESLMISWFANALMRGFDEGMSRASNDTIKKRDVLSIPAHELIGTEALPGERLYDALLRLLGRPTSASGKPKPPSPSEPDSTEPTRG